MRTGRLVLATVIAALSLAAGADADSKLKGWVTKVDPSRRTIDVDGRTISVRDVAVTGGALEPGAFVSVGHGRIKVKPQHRAADDQIIRYPAAAPGNPGRSEFSHLRHFAALAQKQCTTCHSPEMGLVSPSHASRAASAALEPHLPSSKGRFCGTCHDGSTRLSQVGALGGRKDVAIFTTLGTGDARSCARCHAPADHGRDFTRAHGDVAEHDRGTACAACHRQDWGTRERRQQADLLAAEAVLKAKPDDVTAALAVGPPNFCVSCHRSDTKWRE